jgi:murein endopeptidase
VRNPRLAWGTPLTVARLQEVLTDDCLRFLNAKPMVVQDISRRRGGTLKPHLSHHEGRDVDIHLPHRSGARQWGKATPRNLDFRRTWFLISSLYRTGDLEYIFLDKKLERALLRYVLRTNKHASVSEIREIRELFLWVIRHEPGHEYHVHVRFRPGRIDDGCISKTMMLVRKRLETPVYAAR